MAPGFESMPCEQDIDVFSPALFPQVFVMDIA